MGAGEAIAGGGEPEPEPEITPAAPEEKAPEKQVCLSQPGAVPLHLPDGRRVFSILDCWFLASVCERQSERGTEGQAGHELATEGGKERKRGSAG